MSNLTGKTLKNRYEVFEVIGQGGMAIVYKGHDKLLNRMVAIKVLKHEFIDDETFVIKFENEAKASGGLNHPNIVNLYDVGEDGDNYFIIMEYIKGKTLKNYVRQLQGFMQEAAIISIGVQIASALCHAHERGIIHRDIKSQNIMIDEDGIVKVTDFGIAKAVSEATTMNSREVMGSVHYASPEQARGSVVDSRSDLYSTGILLYELITKQTPFDGETQIQIALKQIKEAMPEPKLINEDISLGLNNIVMKLTQKNPNQRYNNASELRHDLSCLKINEDHFIEIDDDQNSHTKMMDDISTLKQFDTIQMNDTQSMDAQSTKRVSGKSKTNLKRMKKKRPQFNRTSAIIAVLLAFVVSGSFFGVLGMYTYDKKMSNKVVVVPELVNHDVNEAIQILSDVGLKYDTTEKQFSNDIKKGYIVSQSVKAGDELKEGYVVRLVVSNGADLIEVPNVIQKNNREGIIDIENQGLEIGEVIYEYSDLPVNMIISQSINPGEKVTKDTKIDLTISQGQKQDTYRIPNLVGRTVEEARKVLSKIGILVGGIQYELSDDVEEGQIIKHSLKGQYVQKGTRVDLVVSNGRITPLPEPEDNSNDSTNPSDTSDQDPTSETKPNEPKNSTKTIKIGANQFFDDRQTIRLELEKDGESEVVHEQAYDKPADYIKIPLSHPAGEYSLKVYFDGILVNTTKLVF